MYALIGILCGLAIYNGTIINLPVPLALYKKLLNKPVNLDDLRELDPQLGKYVNICNLAFQLFRLLHCVKVLYYGERLGHMAVLA